MGSTKSSIRTALSDAGAVPVLLEDGGPAWVAASYEPPDEIREPWVALLPGLDPTPMGWKQREWYLPSSVAQTVFDRNANAGPTVWIDGQIAGGWAQLPSGEVVFDLPDSVKTQYASLLSAAVERTESVIGQARVKPRFPSPSHKALLASA
jgi:hypothetical protein